MPEFVLRLITRKMRRIFFYLVIISFTEEYHATNLPKHFLNLNTIFHWSYKLCQINNYENITEEHVQYELKRVKMISAELRILNDKMKINVHKILHSLMDIINDTHHIHSSQILLSFYIAKIDRYYDISMIYSFDEKNKNNTVPHYLNLILWGKNNIADILSNIYSIFLPNTVIEVNEPFLSSAVQYISKQFPYNCMEHMSIQQKLYYVYCKLILTEMKSLVIMKQIYTKMSSQSRFENKYVLKLFDAENSFKSRVRDYYKIFRHNMAVVSRNIRPCFLKPVVRDIDFIELQNFSRAILLHKDYMDGEFCHDCPPTYLLNRLSQRTNTVVYNCRKIGTSLMTCPANSNSSREYMWWLSENDTYFGEHTACPQMHSISGGLPSYYIAVPVTVLNKRCELCVCSRDHDSESYNEKKSILASISISKQISNIWENKVVTGVRFVKYNNAIHLQIQESSFSFGGLISYDSAWKKLTDRYSYMKKTHRNMKLNSKTLLYTRKILLLDEIRIPRSYVVTGVRFKLLYNVAFVLELFGTHYDLRTGQLNISDSAWFDSISHPIKRKDYMRERSEINLNAADDPSKSSRFQYDSESNKFVRFTHTDFLKDAGQTTIPYFSSQPVESRPAFPLSGIALSFRGNTNYGGYITPQIYTVSVSSYMKRLLRTFKSASTTQPSITDDSTTEEDEYVLNENKSWFNYLQ